VNVQAITRFHSLACAALLAWGAADLCAQDILTLQLQQGFGKNKVRYRDFQWEILESEHIELHFESEFQNLAVQAIEYLEEGYDHISQILHHDLSHRPPVVIYQSHYQFQQTNIFPDFLPPGVAGFAEPLRFRMVVPFAGDLDEFRNVLVHELTHIFQYDIVHKGPIRRITSPIVQPPTWLMEGMAEYTTPGRNTIDEMVLRDAVLTDGLIPLETMNQAWGQGNVFLAYKQSHALMEYIAEHYGPEKISRILRLWDSQHDTDKLMDRLIGMDLKTLDERWSAQMRKAYWPLLQTRDYTSEFAEEIGDDENIHSFSSPCWSLSGDMLAVHSSDGIEQHVDIIRLRDASLVERVTESMRAADYDHLSIGTGTVAWAQDGQTIAFIAKEGPRDRIMLWNLYDKKLVQTLTMPDLDLVESLTWSPDSRHLAFIGTGQGQSDLYIIDVQTGERRQLTGTPEREDYPNWSPDGQRIAFSSKYRNQFDIKIYDLAESTAHAAIASSTDDLWPQWLPEGNKLLFVSTRDKINDLFVYHLDEGREFRLTRSLSGIMNPALSPDGRQIVFNTYFKGRNHLYRMAMPEWPEVKRKDAQLLARVDKVAPPVETEPQAIKALAIERPVVEGDAALSDQGGIPNLGQVSALKDQEISDDAVLLAGASGPLPPTESQEPQATAQLIADDSDDELELRRRRYTPKLEFDGISVQMGYFDGFLSSIAQLSMSDLLGNHSLVLATDYVAAQDISNDFNFAASYSYYGKRPTYHVSIFNWNQYFINNRNFLVPGRAPARGISRLQQRGALANASYPLDLYRRLDLSYTYVGEQEEQVSPFYEPDSTATSTHLFKTAYVHDSITYGLLGATAGKRYFLSVGRTLSLGSTTRSFSHLEFDYRHYLRLGRWSVLGLRAYSVGSLGRDALEYNLGGPTWFLPFYTGFNLNTGPLRGYQFSAFTGSRVLLTNAELRVPFVRGILFGWPGTFLIPAVDGSLFMDMGMAWNKGEEIDLWPFRNPHAALTSSPRQVHASVGFGLLVYFLLPMNFEFARQMDLQGNFSDFKFHFSFGQSF
jgi:hypothetical protein